MSLAASDAEELSGSVTDPAPSRLPAPSAAKAGMDAEFFRVLSKAVEELGLEWSPPEEPSRSRLDEWFLPGRRQAPQQRPSPFFPEVHDELTRSWRSPYSARLRTSASSALTTIDGAEEKGYERMPQLDESVAAHLCPPTAIGWKAKASHPSKPCRTTLALAGRSYASAGQAASQMPESRPHETAVQDDHAEADPLADSHRGLVLFSGPERRILSHPDSPPSQTILEIRLRGSGLPVHGPTLWAVSGPPYFYEVHGRGNFPSETDGHSQLPR